MTPRTGRTKHEPLLARRERIDAREGARTLETRIVADVLDAVGALLASLRHVQNSHALERRFCRDAAAVCDFTRVMLSRVESDDWRPWKVSFTINPDFDRHFATHLRGARIPFAESPAEDDARRQLMPVIVDPDFDPTAMPLPLVGLTSSYVVVPLTGSTGVFGLVHADHHPRARPVDDIDRDALWLLADAFSTLYERAVLRERLRGQHIRLRHALDDLDAGATSVVNTGTGLERDHPPQDHPAATPADATVLQAAHLTPREQDVAELIARGYGNAAIARDLVIVEGTVKTHVKSVMRKLGAASRAEAIAIILGHRTRE